MATGVKQQQQAKQQTQARQQQQLAPKTEQHYRAVHAAQVGVAKRGAQALAANLNRGRWARFEKQVDELYPGLREHNHSDFAQRVQALNKAHMAKCTAASLAARRKASEICPDCREEQGGSPDPTVSEMMCPKHQRAWAKKFEALKRARGISPERAAEIERAARLA